MEKATELIKIATSKMLFKWMKIIFTQYAQSHREGGPNQQERNLSRKITFDNKGLKWGWAFKK